MNRKRIITIVLGAVLLILATTALIQLLLGRAERKVEEERRMAESETLAGLIADSDAFLAVNPLVALLPYRSPDKEFEVHYGIKSHETREASYQIIIRLSGADNQEEINFIKKKAGDWFLEKGYNLNEIDPEWIIRYKDPLSAYLPLLSEEFEIYKIGTDKYTDEARYVIQIKPKLRSGEEGSQEEIDALVTKATEWITSKGFNVDNLSVKWIVKA